MTTVDMEQMLRESTELTPSPQLKSKALTKAVAAMSERASLACREEDNRVPARGILMRRVVALAVCLILVCGITAFGWWISNDSFRIVYVDVNPSVALHVNRFERVCEVEFLNEDAQRILSDVRLNRCTVEDALANIIDACTASGYMDGAAELYISAKDGDAQIYLIESTPGIDMRKSVFTVCADNRWPLVGLTPVGTDLESIFIGLVDRSDKQAADKKITKSRRAH